MEPVLSNPLLHPAECSSPESGQGDAAPHLQQIDAEDRTRGLSLCQRSLTAPVQVPPINIRLPEVPANEFDYVDEMACYILATGYANGGGLLTAGAAKALKSVYSAFFGNFPDEPAYEDEWDILMNSRGQGGKFYLYNLVAKLVYDYQKEDNLAEILTVPKHGWHAVKTTFGVFRTGSFAIYSANRPGEIIAIDTDGYRAKKENERLRAENAMLKEQFHQSIALLDRLHQSVSDSSQTEKDRLDKLRAVLFSATDQSANAVTYPDLIKVHSLIFGEDYLRAKASFEQHNQHPNERQR